MIISNRRTERGRRADPPESDAGDPKGSRNAIHNDYHTFGARRPPRRRHRLRTAEQRSM
jgi:hypothetical protein